LLRKIYEKNIIFSFLFAASVLQAAEFEVVDQLTVDGATTLKSSVVVIVPNLNLPLSLWVSTSAITPHLYVSTNGNVGIGTTAPGTTLSFGGFGSIWVNNDASNPFGMDTVSMKLRLFNGNPGTGAYQTQIGGMTLGTFTPYVTIGDGEHYFNRGNVGIGTTNPSTKLHISSGTLTIDGNVDTSINAVGDIPPRAIR